MFLVRKLEKTSKSQVKTKLFIQKKSSRKTSNLKENLPKNGTKICENSKMTPWNPF